MTSTARPYRDFVKPIIDRLAAAVLLVLLAPALLLIALAVRCFLAGPVLFVQTRVGKEGRGFQMFKFRTMRSAVDAAGRPLPDALRLTRFGQWLRGSSLDELPELWNVLRGEMSLVGPRPLLVEYLPFYTQQESRRHDVLPGITGWAQVHGRNDIAWERKFALDVWYVDHCSLRVDLQILLTTVLRVVARQGINAPGSATAEPLTSTRRGVAVLGAGGHASVVIATLQEVGIPIDAAYDDNPARHGERILGVDIRGPLSLVEPGQRMRAVIALGDSKLRHDLAAFLALDWISIVHPRATVHESVALGRGTVVFANATVQPNCKIGRHAIVNTSASIDHDCRIGDFAHVGPGAVLAGGVRVGEHTLLGVGSCVAPGVRIGSRTVVGAGAVVVADLPDDVVAVGCPARIIRRNPAERAAA